MACAGLGPVEQDYLLEARQMQALSFAVHIPLVCFGVAFPMLVLRIEWLGRRRDDPLLIAAAAAAVFAEPQVALADRDDG